VLEVAPRRQFLEHLHINRGLKLEVKLLQRLLVSRPMLVVHKSPM
jgi:hypothetical protein